MFEFTKAVLTSKFYWFIVLGGSAVCTVPVLIILAILQVPDSFWWIRTGITILIVGTWGTLGALREWREHKEKQEDEHWYPGREKEGKIPPMLDS